MIENKMKETPYVPYDTYYSLSILSRNVILIRPDSRLSMWIYDENLETLVGANIILGSPDA